MPDIISHESALLLIIVLPLLGAILNGLVLKGDDRFAVSVLGVGVVLGAFGLACWNFFAADGLLAMKAAGQTPRIEFQFYEWFRIAMPGVVGGAPVPINVRFSMDALSGLMTLVVTGIGALIHIYSIGYMDEEKAYNRFFAYLNLFTASMLILVLASNIVVMFVGWEGVGLCSYLLIGFWFENKDYAAAGRKAFVANRVGDLGVLIGMFILAMVAGSFEFTEINANASSFSRPFPFAVDASMATVAGLFLFLGVTGKSAQVPLYVWLPDAMAGPTPVSALIHAATMVTAGVYLMCRLSPIFILSDATMAVIAIIGTVTALMAATIAVVQKEMKKILAYSTVSQLGFMVAACGVGAFSAGFFHVFTHAFFKACLFLGAGAVMHSVHAHGDANIFKLGGLSSKMKVTNITFLISCCAIAGVPLFSGFFSKDSILEGAALATHGEGGWLGWFVLVGLTLAATLTAFYMFRLYFLTFTGDYRSAEDWEGHKGADGDDHHSEDGHGDDHDHDHGYDAHPHAASAPIQLALVVLGAGALLAGYLGYPEHVPFTHIELGHSFWFEWMSSSVTNAAHEHEFGLIAIAGGCGLGAMLVGVGGAFVLYKGKNEDTFTTKFPKGLHSFLFNKWYVDELYGKIIIGPIRTIARVVGNVDQTFVDGIIAGLTSKIVSAVSWVSTRAQTGGVHTYGLGMTLGVLGVLFWAVTPRTELSAEVRGTNVQLAATTGFGYEFQFDGDSDGFTEQTPTGQNAADRDWAPEATFAPQYYADDYQGLVLTVRTQHPQLPEQVEVGEHWQVLDFVPAGWDTIVARDPETGEPMEVGPTADIVVRVHDGTLQIRPNGAELRVNGRAWTPAADTSADAGDSPDGESDEGEAEDGHNDDGRTATLQPGEGLTVGKVDLRVSPVVRATVRVRNPFGNVSIESVDIVLEQPAPAVPEAPAGDQHAALEAPRMQRQGTNR